MTREEFDQLVRTVENGLARRPKALRWRVTCLALLGYGGLLAWLLAVWLLAALFFILAAFLELSGRITCGVIGVMVLFGGSWAVMRVLLVRVPPPEGREVSRAEAPGLFTVLDDLRSRLRSPPFDRVLLLPECNAAVVQVPRMGVLGWFRNYLMLGLPLLEGLTPEEFRAVLAHELAHLSREHGRFGHWIYRLRRSWSQVFEQLSRPQVKGEVSFRPLITKFVDWFWPRFNACAFVLSRTDEHEADSMAARLAGADKLGSALLRLAIYDEQLDGKFWPDLWQRANTEPQPPSGVFARIHDCLRIGPTEAECAKWMEKAFALTTTNADTHPCLKDRLRALGCLPNGSDSPRLPAPPPPVQHSAAEACLGPALESVRQEVEQRWRQQCEPVWKERHAKAGSLQHRLNRLEQTVPLQDVDSLWDKARVLLELQGKDAAKPLLGQILAANPAHVPANFELGRMLLEDGDAEGESCLERATAEDEQVFPAGCALLHHYYRRMGRTEDLRALAARMDKHEKDLDAARTERSTVTASDPLIPHALSEEELAALRQVLAAEPELLAAELGQKGLRHFPKQKLFLLCLYRRPAWHRLPDRDSEQGLVNRLSQTVRLPGRVLVFAPRASFRPLARKLSQVPCATVFRRE